MAAATGQSTTCFVPRGNFLFLLVVPIFCLKVGRMSEQLEKLQVDTEELEKQTNKQKRMKWVLLLVFERFIELAVLEALEKRLKGKNNRAQEAVTESRCFQQDE